jgi:hypothetical protein
VTFFPRVEKWVIPESTLTDSFHEMACDGRKGNEGVMLWLGRRRGGCAEITHIVALRGSGVIKEPDRLIITSGLLNQVTDLAIGLGVVLVGQIHSHGPGHGNGLSFTDRKFGICVPYYLSVVASNYAMEGNTGISDCGVYVYEPEMGFQRMPHVELEEKIILVSKPRLPVLVAGQE